MTLPPRYTVRDYLKNQGAKLAGLSEEHARGMLRKLAHRYQSRSLDGPALHQIGDDYLESIRLGGGFSLTSEYRSATSNAPYRERVLVSGYTLEPVGLGQGWADDTPHPYVENAALLRCYIGSFQRRKASLGSGISCVLLTQHLLERIYERTEVQRSDLANLIESEIPDFLRAMAFAESASMWIETVEGNQISRVTAVPFSNGLIIANERYLYANANEGQLGYRIEIPSGKMSEPFVNKGRLLSDGSVDSAIGLGGPITVVCGVTYMNITTLDDDESDYYYTFKACLDCFDEGMLDAMAMLEFGPSKEHEKAVRNEVAGETVTRVVRLRNLLRSGWLKSRPSKPICFLLPYDCKLPSSLRQDLAAVG